MKTLTSIICSKITACSIGVALFGLTAQAQTYPTIGIQGLAGAEHWVWIEAEYLSNSAAPATFAANQSGSPLSGYMEGGPANIIEKTSGTINPITWNLYAPAAMSANTAFYGRALLSPPDARATTISIDGTAVSDPALKMYKRGHGGIPAQWIGFDSTTNFRADIGAITAGAHELKISTSTWGWKWDGVLIYDGTPTLGAIVDNGTGRWWMTNPGSVNSPVLNGNVAPTFTIGGLAEGSVVQYFLNGQAYTPGTVIGPGENYQLVVAIFESSDPNSQRLAFAGANFSVANSIPEPSSYAVLLSGAIAGYVLIGRRRRCEQQ